MDRQRAQEASDFGRPHLRGVALAEEEDVASDPRDVGFLGAAAVMASTEGRAHPIEQSRLGWPCRAGLGTQVLVQLVRGHYETGARLLNLAA